MQCRERSIALGMLALALGVCGTEPVRADIHDGGYTGLKDLDPACIELQPGSTVAVGEELLIFANQCPPIADVWHAVYEWDFGDDLTEPAEGRSVSHFYMRPGTFALRLRMYEGRLVNNFGTDTTQDDIWEWTGSAVEYSVEITVTGDPLPVPPLVDEPAILKLPFEDSISDESGNAVPVGWADGPGSFTDGIQGRALDLTGGKFLSIPNGGSVMGGLSEFTISFWFKRPPGGSFGHILNQYDAALQGSSGAGVRLNFGAGCALNVGCEPYFGLDARWRTSPSTGGLLRSGVSSNAAFNDNRWHHGAYTYLYSPGTAQTKAVVYLDGRALAEFTTLGPLDTSTAPLTIGGDLDGAHTHLFGGYLDELTIYPKALTREQLFDGVVVRHANFQARTAQFIRVQTPDSYRAQTLQVAVAGGGLTQEVMLLEKTGPDAEETALLRNAELPGSPLPYELIVRYRDPSDAVLYETRERFDKTYDGAPSPGLNEYNATVVNGEPVYPFGPWGLNNDDIDEWAAGRYANILIGQGFWGSGEEASYTVAGFEEYLDLGLASGLPVIGPAMWDGDGELNAQNEFHDWTIGMTARANLNKIAEYAGALGSHPNLMAWHWLDEPNIWGVRAQTVRAWTRQSHLADNLHPVLTNLMGHPYSDCAASYWLDDRRTYTYEYNANLFGRRTPLVDIYKFDIYPIDAAWNPAAPDATLDCYVSALENYRIENADLVPTWSSIETANATGFHLPEDDPSPWKITPAQIRMLVWLNVVHEVKGFLWFQYFRGTPAENLAEMAALVEKVNGVAAAALGPRVQRGVTVSTDLPARIDTMVREYNGEIYLFAVRVSEVESTDYGRGYVEPIQKYSVQAEFQIDGLADGRVSVYDEGRSLRANGGAIRDTFAPFAVHVYKISGVGLRGRVSGQTAYLEWNANLPLPEGATWRIRYTGPAGSPASPIANIPVGTTHLTLENLTLYSWYTVTVEAMSGGEPVVSDSILLLPTDQIVYLPVISR